MDADISGRTYAFQGTQIKRYSTFSVPETLTSPTIALAALELRL